VTVPRDDERMRMFAAVVPPEDVVEDLEEFLEPRRAAGDLRWTVPDTWHVTLAFLADVPDARLEDLQERLDRAGRRRTPFALRLGGGGAFPHVAHAKLLYADVHGHAHEDRSADESREELSRLATGVRAAAGRAGAPVDGARFRPHVTLGRTRRPHDVVRWVRLLDTWSSRPFVVEELVLVQSFLGEGPRGRPRHETRSVHPLRGVSAT
jgi:2'-5' RNA ligase